MKSLNIFAALAVCLALLSSALITDDSVSLGSEHVQEPLKQNSVAGRRCGVKFGGRKCSQSQCCSAAGWCGTSEAYCSVPGNCQEAYGFCDSKKAPVGPDMATVKGRPSIVNTAKINGCVMPRTFALSYDDGPSEYTDAVLDILQQHDGRGTFFLGGVLNGRGSIDVTWKDTVSRMMQEQHQIGSHTWSHPNLDSLTSEQRRLEMYKNEVAILNVIGAVPRYMRAPMIICGDACQKDMTALGYTIVGWQYDSQDWRNPQPSNMEEIESLSGSMDRIDANDNMFIIQHDIHNNTAAVTDAILTHMEETKPDWRAVTLAECLGLPFESAFWTPSERQNVHDETSKLSMPFTFPNQESKQVSVSMSPWIRLGHARKMTIILTVSCLILISSAVV